MTSSAQVAHRSPRRSKMPERTIWINPDQTVEYCPHCKSFNIRLAEGGGYGSCNDCEQNFHIRYKKPPKNGVKRRGTTPEEVRDFVRRQAEEFGC